MDDGTGTAADRFAFVTGTTRGIGAAVATQLLERGWRVLGVARTSAPINHPSYRHVVCDLIDSAALQRAIGRPLGEVVTDARWRRIGLVNNAATPGVLGPVETIDPITLLQLSAVNWVAPTWQVTTPAQAPNCLTGVSANASAVSMTWNASDPPPKCTLVPHICCTKPDLPVCSE